MAKYLKVYNKGDLHKPADSARVAYIDLETGRIMQQENAILFGVCSRCGHCCLREDVPFPHPVKPKCVHLKRDGFINHGTKKFRCAIYPTRPARCAHWPELKDKMPPQCSYYWMKGT
jgi:Fe-S-cluster containining protein